MKKARFPLQLLAVTTLMVATSGAIPAQAQTEPSTSPGAVSAPAPLPYGVEDVLKLSRAQISEDIILNYVHNSGTIYNLTPNDIVYLRNEGVKDGVIHAMLDQRKRLTDPAAPAQTHAAPASATSPAPVYQEQQQAQPAPVYQEQQQQAQSAPVYAEAPLQPAASSVYVVGDPAVRAAYYGYPYPYGYGGYGYGYPYYWGPSISIGFGYYGGYYHGGYYGHGHYGYGHGGYGHGGGGWHGGGGHGHH